MVRIFFFAIVVVTPFSSALSQSEISIERVYYPGTVLVKSESRNGVVTTFTYESNGDLRTRTDARGYVTYFGDYKLGIPQTEIHAQGTPEEFTLKRVVDNAGCISSETDGVGNITAYDRDSYCRPLSITKAKTDAYAMNISYVAHSIDGPSSETTTRGTFVETKIFDSFGRLSRQTSAGVTRAWDYDGLGRKVFESVPVIGAVSSPLGDHFSYDALGRLKIITHADGSTVGYEYAFNNITGGLEVKTTDERGNVITHTFRAFGSPETAELMEVSTPVADANIMLKRNVKGQVTEVKQGGLTRSYGYDSRFYLTSVVNPETGTTTYERDALDNITSVKVGTAGTTYFDLDGLGQLTAIRYPDATKNVSQTWTKNGLRKTASNAAGSWAWEYDANKNMTQERLEVGVHSFSTDYAYDGNDHLKQISYPKRGSVLDLAPDVLGRPTKVGGYVSAVSYHPSGLIQSMTYANGVATAMSLDSRQRPATIRVGKGGGEAYAGLTVGYDNANNVSTVADSANASNNRSYGYDGIDRMTSVSYAGQSYPISYDGAGNITRQSFGGVLDYVYDKTSNRLTSTTGVKAGSYSYDARGNITSNGSIAFQYDDNSRLICAKCGAPDQITYDYDALGMRLSRTKGGQTTYQIYRGNGDLLMEFNTATNQRQEHIYLNGQKIATSTQSAYFATAVNLSVSSTAIKPGQSVTLTAAVSGGRKPDGVVNFYDNGVFIGSGTIANGKATLSTAALPFGYHNFTAAYVNDGSNASSSTAVATRVESGQVTATIMGIINSLLLDD